MAEINLRLHNGRLLTAEQVTAFDAAVNHHAPIDLSCLAYVCLECGSIGCCHDSEARDSFVVNYDWNCCGTDVTVGVTSA